MKFSRKLFTAIFLVLISFLCCCSNIFQKEDEALGYVRINIGSAGLSRTLLPVIDNNDIEEIHLLSRRSVDVEYEEGGSWESVSDIPELSFATGPWWFKLVVHTDQCSFSDTSHIEITSGEHRNLSFSLTSNLDKGGMYLKLNLTGNAAAADFTFTEYSTGNEVDSGALDIKGTSSAHYVEYARRIQYPSEALSEGNYYITVTLYGDIDRQLVLNTYEEAVQIKNGFTSKGERTIELNGIYSIEYDKNGGSEGAGVSLKTLFTERSADYTLPSLTKTGYTFGGWYESSDFSGSPVTVLSQGTNTDKHFYAKWNPIIYSITYIVNEGIFVETYTKPESYTIETQIGLPDLTNITKYGYDFDGWYTDSSFTGNSVSYIDFGSMGNKTYYAKWLPVDRAIIFETDGGMWTGSINTPNVYNIETPAFTLPSASDIHKNGYEFGGWYDNEECTGTVITIHASGQTGIKTYYAKWFPVEYDITFNENSGTFSSTYTKPTKYTIESSDITLPTSLNITRSGYTFDGWYESQDTYGNVQGNEVTQIDSGSTGNKTYYAKWTIDTYSITYVTNGGSFASGYTKPENYTVASPATLPTSSNITKTGYTFGGWYEDSTLSGTAVTSTSSTTTGDKTYYAKWTATEYSITYNLNSGTNSSSNPSTYTIESSTITLADPTRTNFTFDGWYTSSTFAEGTKKTSIPAGSTGIIRLYAKWVANVDIDAIISQIQNADSGEIVSVSGAFTTDEFTSLCSAVKARTSAIGLDLSDVVGITTLANTYLNGAGSKVNYLVLPDGLTTIASTALHNLGSTGAPLSITIPKNVSSISNQAFFKGCISEILVDSDNQYFASYNGCLYTKDYKTFKEHPYRKTGEITLKQGVEIIASQAFAARETITEVNIPSSIKTIKANAFANIATSYTINISSLGASSTLTFEARSFNQNNNSGCVTTINYSNTKEHFKNHVVFNENWNSSCSDDTNMFTFSDGNMTWAEFMEYYNTP